MSGSDPPPFGPADFATRSDYASLDEQLERYFKKSASGIIVPLLFSFLPLAFCNGIKSGITDALSVFAALSLLFTVFPPVVCAGRMEAQLGDPGNSRRTNQTRTRRDVSSLKNLCVAAYASNILLMLTAVCLASVAKNEYLALVMTSAVLLIIVSAPLVMLIYCGHQNGFIWGAQQYRSHQSDLKFFLDLSSDVAQIAVTGLSGSLVGNMKKTRRLERISVSAVEVFVMYAGVISLFLMLACTMPPAFVFSTTRQFVADKILWFVASLSVVLISVAAFLVVVNVVGPYAVLAATPILAVGAFWLYKVSRCRIRPSAGLLDGSPQGAEARHAANERSLMWMGIHSVMFGTMMASYSAFQSGQRMSNIYKFFVFFVFAAQLANISRMVLVRQTRDDTVNASVVRALGIAMALCMLPAPVLLIVLAVWQPGQLMTICGVA